MRHGVKSPSVFTVANHGMEDLDIRNAERTPTQCSHSHHDARELEGRGH